MEYEIVKAATVGHKGIFKIDEVLCLIDSWVRHHDYYKEVTQTKGAAKKEARSQHRSFELHKRVSATYISVIIIDASFSDVKDKTFTVDGVRESFQNGKVEISLKGFNMSSTKFQWEGQPVIAFVRGIVDKFIYKINRGTASGICASDTMDLTRQLRSLLHSYKKRVNP